MRRVMIVGQPGSGKSTLARALGARTGLPVIHMDHIHWKPGWIERDRAEKDRLVREAHAGEAWVFEGGHSATYGERLARADTLIWLDVPLGLRLRRVVTRTFRHRGRTRPDLPEGCPERLGNLPEFVRFIWRSRRTSRERIARLVTEAGPGTEVVILSSGAQVESYLSRAVQGCPAQ